MCAPVKVCTCAGEVAAVVDFEPRDLESKDGRDCVEEEESVLPGRGAFEGFQRMTLRSEEPLRRYCAEPELKARAWMGPA